MFTVLIHQLFDRTTFKTDYHPGTEFREITLLDIFPHGPGSQQDDSSMVQQPCQFDVQI